MGKENKFNFKLDPSNLKNLHYGDIIKNYYHENLDKNKDNRQQKRIGLRMYMGIFVICTIISTLFYYKLKPDVKQDSFEPFPIDINKGTFIVKAVNYYNTHEYYNALKELRNSKDSSEFAMFYMSNCHMFLNSYSEARYCLKAISKENSEYSIEAEWLFALSYYYENELDSAKLFLTEISIKKGRYQKEAEALLISIYDKNGV